MILTIKIDEHITNRIYVIREIEVMLDSDLAILYECSNSAKDINKVNEEIFIRELFKQIDGML